MNSIKLDHSKLLGFRLLGQGDAPSATIGGKAGQKVGLKAGLKLGLKAGLKAGLKSST
ncbi:hypothetical protein [Celeribacter sp. ULVN23_4]